MARTNTVTSHPARLAATVVAVVFLLWLHLILAIGMIGLGVVLRRASAARRAV